MRGNMFKNLLFVSTVLFINVSATYAQSCDRKISSAERKVNSTEATCERSQDRVKLLENSKATSLEALRTREEIANNLNRTDSISCTLAEAFGECAARRRRRNFVAELNRREAFFNRRIKTQADRANRDCLKFSSATERLSQVRSSCQAPLS